MTETSGAHTDSTISSGEPSKKDQEVKGLRIRILNYGFIIALASLAIVLFVITVLLSGAYKRVNEIADNYHRVELDATMVQSASDDLTRDVGFFVMTGDRKYMDDYFAEANNVRRRENAIADLKQLHVTDAMITYLEDAVEESMNLMQLEYDAIRYAAEGFGLDISKLPQAIQDTSLPSASKTMTAEEKINKAREIVFGDDYLSYKARIRGNEDKYYAEATKLMEKLEADGRHEMNILLVTQWIAIIAIVGLGLFLFMAISRLIVRPLGKAVSSIAHGEKISPLSGIFEIQFMSHYYNDFHSRSMEVQKRLKQDAERDALTGVLNRRGYQTVIDKLASETFPLAVLIFDVDHFKLINDSYGHEVGDMALKKLADLLKETFRGTDIVARIGGDEFTVILFDVTEKNRRMIEKKVRIINEALEAPGPGRCPGFSASVGCAFSTAGYNNHSFNQADEKMYVAKKAGGGDIRFA